MLRDVLAVGFVVYVPTSAKLVVFSLPGVAWAAWAAWEEEEEGEEEERPLKVPLHTDTGLHRRRRYPPSQPATPSRGGRNEKPIEPRLYDSPFALRGRREGDDREWAMVVLFLTGG